MVKSIDNNTIAIPETIPITYEYMHVQEVYPGDGPNFNGNIYRFMNSSGVVKANTINGASWNDEAFVFSSDSIGAAVLPAGKYLIEGFAAGWSCNRHVISIERYTVSTLTDDDIIQGSSVHTTSSSSNISFAKGVLTFEEEESVIIRHRVQTAGTQGKDNSYILDQNVYAQLFIIKLS